MPADRGNWGFLSEAILDTRFEWSCGSFGALAEFALRTDEPREASGDERMVEVRTALGGVRLLRRTDGRLLALERTSRAGWVQQLSLCLPAAAAAMHGRQVLTELGPDLHAIHHPSREGVLFDLGLGAYQLDACIRVTSPPLLRLLRRRLGRPLFGPDDEALKAVRAESPVRVFITAAGRIEVAQPIPPEHGMTPAGPHTHVLPRLLGARLTHPATEPAPPGFVPCMAAYPPHPLEGGGRTGFDHEQHAAWLDLLDRFGDPALLRIKRRVAAEVRAGRQPWRAPPPGNRFARPVVRATLRQLEFTDPGARTLSAWRACFDAPRETGLSRAPASMPG